MSKNRIVSIEHIVDVPNASVVVRQSALLDHESRRADAIRTTHIVIEGTTYSVDSAASLAEALTEALGIAARDFGEV